MGSIKIEGKAHIRAFTGPATRTPPKANLSPLPFVCFLSPSTKEALMSLEIIFVRPREKSKIRKRNMN